MSKAFADVQAERARQIGRGFIAATDDALTGGELARAAVAYGLEAMNAARGQGGSGRFIAHGLAAWPFAYSGFGSQGRRRDLVRMAALAIAEIDRLDRAEAAGKAKPENRRATYPMPRHKRNPADLLVDLGLATSRPDAIGLIDSGCVRVDGAVLRRGVVIYDGQQIAVRTPARTASA